MPCRKTPLVNGEIYHAFNRSIAQVPIFNNKRNCDRFLETVDYYRFERTPFRFSYFQRLSQSRKQELIQALSIANKQKVEILAFGVMPNHYHFLLKQTANDGISEYLRLIQDSYAKYYNLISQRTGSVFQQSFKATRIETEGQFIHTARYIHLNPLTSFIIKTPKELALYPLPSFPAFISASPRQFINPQPLSSLFSSTEKLNQFTADQVDHQRSLAQIKHITFD